MNLINKITLIIFFSINFISCTPEKDNTIIKSIITKKNNILENNKNEVKENSKNNNQNFPFYFLENSYFIEGIEYFPKENYSYSETGLASYYGKELHGKITVNNEINDVTELYGRHKTLPIPSVVKVTNLDNGTSVIVRINDRGPSNNTRIIEVSRKVAQLLKFYKSKIAKVRVDILSDQSKQLKIVMESINNPDFNETIESAPTIDVKILDLGETQLEESDYKSNAEKPIELLQEEVLNNDVYLSIYNLKSYNEAKNIVDSFPDMNMPTIERNNDIFNVIFGPIDKNDVDILFQEIKSKGYKEIKVIVK